MEAEPSIETEQNNSSQQTERAEIPEQQLTAPEAETEQVNQTATLPLDLSKLSNTELEAHLHETLAGFEARETELNAELTRLFSVFQAWLNTTTENEVERAAKRLRTRISFLELSQSSLDDKKKHYGRVVEAFQSALALL